MHIRRWRGRRKDPCEPAKPHWRARGKLGRHQRLASQDEALGSTVGEDAQPRRWALLLMAVCSTGCMILVIAAAINFASSIYFAHNVESHLSTEPVAPPPSSAPLTHSAMQPPTWPLIYPPVPALGPKKPPFLPPTSPPRPFSQPPMLAYVMEGCSGSSFVGTTLLSLLACSSGWEILHMDGELLKVNKNEWYADLQRETSWTSSTRLWNATLRRMWSEARARRTSIMINADYHSGSQGVMKGNHTRAVPRAGTQHPRLSRACGAPLFAL